MSFVVDDLVVEDELEPVVDEVEDEEEVEGLGPQQEADCQKALSQITVDLVQIIGKGRLLLRNVH